MKLILMAYKTKIISRGNKCFVGCAIKSMQVDNHFIEKQFPAQKEDRFLHFLLRSISLLFSSIIFYINLKQNIF